MLEITLDLFTVVVVVVVGARVKIRTRSFGRNWVIQATLHTHLRRKSIKYATMTPLYPLCSHSSPPRFRFYRSGIVELQRNTLQVCSKRIYGWCSTKEGSEKRKVNGNLESEEKVRLEFCLGNSLLGHENSEKIGFNGIVDVIALENNLGSLKFVI